MGGPFALHGHRLMEGHNNQPKVASTMGGVLKRRGDRGGTWGGGVSSLGVANQRRKKMTTKIHRGLRRPQTNENHTTTNLKHAGMTKEVKEGSCDW